MIPWKLRHDYKILLYAHSVHTLPVSLVQVCAAAYTET
jgi:hypothetical protein